MSFVSKIFVISAMLGFVCISNNAEAQSSDYSPRTATYPCRSLGFGAITVNMPHGGFRDITFAPQCNKDADATLSSLNISVLCGAFPFPEKHRDARLFLVGRMAKHITPREQEIPGEELIGPTWYFILEGWFLEVPYWEIPQIPDYEKPQADIFRHELLPKDLGDANLWKLIRYDARRKLDWAGIDPPHGR